MNAGTTRRHFLRIAGAVASGCMFPGIPFFSVTTCRASASDNPAVYTGFPCLDRIIGGFGPGDLILLAGRPYSGKSTLAHDIMVNAAVKNGIPIGLFSLSLPQDRLARQILSRVEHIGTCCAPRKPLSFAQMGSFRSCTGVVQPSPILIDDSVLPTIKEIREVAQDWKERHGVMFLVIDYIQLAQQYRPGYEFAAELKETADRIGLPILALSSLFRHVESRSAPQPMLSDLEYPRFKTEAHPLRGVETYADVVLFTYREGIRVNPLFDLGRPHLVNPMAEGKEITEVIVAKTRHGASGSARLRFHPEFNSFLS